MLYSYKLCLSEANLPLKYTSLLKNPNRRKRLPKQHIDRKLIFRLRMFLLILIVMFGIVVYDMVTEVIGWLLVLGGISVGVVIGYAVGYLSEVRWHEETSKVIARMDRLGGATLVLYLLFSLSRRWIFGHWIHGSALTAFSFSIVLGAMSGRFLITRKKIVRILKEEGLL